MRWRFATIPLVVTSLAAGCDFNLTEVHPGGLVQASFSIDIRSTEGQGPLHLVATLEPGADSEGEIRAVPDDSLRVDGIALTPIEVTTGGRRFYLIRDLVPSSPVLRIGPPAILGVNGSGEELEVEPLRAEPPDTLAATRADGLEIRLIGVSPLAEDTVGFWSLAISAEGCDRLSLLSFSGTTAPPPVLRLPLDPLPATFEEGFVHYRANVRTDSTNSDLTYRVAVSRSLDACIPLAVRD